MRPQYQCRNRLLGFLLRSRTPRFPVAQAVAEARACFSTGNKCASETEPRASSFEPIKKLLVANRGEIACRVITTAKKLGIPTVAVYSDADRYSKHAQLADESFCIGGAAARDSYLRYETILAVAKKAGVRSIHPGYGFLSENAVFSDLCAKEGIQFVGPPGSAIRSMGDKAEAKRIMSAAGVPVVPGYHGEDQSEERLLKEAELTGFPLLIKAVSGGGGKGMKVALNMREVAGAVASAKREAAASFGDDRVLMERYITRPRHVEVQVVADSHGNAVYLFDRDCSLQRRHQKVIEEAPAPGLSDLFHATIGDAAVKAAKACGYVNAGTVEFIVDADSPTKEFFFMEMNTRLQVEHPVTEAVSGVDLVEWQLIVAAGMPLPRTSQEAVGNPHGHAFEARLYAESPRNNFLPGAGTVHRWRPPTDAVSFSHLGGAIRVDSGVHEGDDVGINYDPMIAKVVCWGPDRSTALKTLRHALANTQVSGLPLNLHFLRRLAAHPSFEAAGDELTTAFIATHKDELMKPQALPAHVAAIAAIARHQIMVAKQKMASPPSATAAMGPWAIADGKRLWGCQVLDFKDMSFPEGEGAAHAKLSLRVTVNSSTSFEVVCPNGDASKDESISVMVRDVEWSAAMDSIKAEVDGRKVHADVSFHRHGAMEDVLSLWMQEDSEMESYEFRWPVQTWSKDAMAGSHSAAGGGKVVSPMPGRVVKLLVAAGDKVTAGAVLAIVEAMKMEHPIVATCDGIVNDLTVSPGAQILDGQALMWIEKEAAETS